MYPFFRTAKGKKVKKALTLGKGLKLHCQPSEWEVEGGKLSWKGFKRGVKKAFSKGNLKSAVRTGIKAAVKGAVSALPGGPIVGAIAGKYTDKLVDTIGDKTGGFGLRRRRKRAVAPTRHHGGGDFRLTDDSNVKVLETNFSNFINPKHPAFKPTLDAPDFSLPRSRNGRGVHPRFTSGGSFMASGGSFKTSGHGLTRPAHRPTTVPISPYPR